MCGGRFRMLMLMHSNKLFRVIFVTLGWPNCCFSSYWLAQDCSWYSYKATVSIQIGCLWSTIICTVMVQTSMLCNMQMVYLTLLHWQHRFWLESWFLWWEENQRIQKQNLGVWLRLTNLSPCTMYKARIKPALPWWEVQMMTTAPNYLTVCLH